MSKLDELIAEYCPNGVPFIALKDCIESVSNIKWAENKDSEFQYIDLTSVDRETHSIVETSTINADTAPSRAQQIVKTNDILLGTTRPLLKRYCIIPMRYNGEICSTGFCVLRAKSSVVLPRYLYHVISTTDFFDHVEKFQKGASYPAITDADVKKYKIPAPSIEVQREIVRILDDFTELTTHLQEQLAKELTARKKQYEYYRDKLLTFDVLGGGQVIVYGGRLLKLPRLRMDTLLRHRTKGMPDLSELRILMKMVVCVLLTLNSLLLLKKAKNIS